MNEKNNPKETDRARSSPPASRPEPYQHEELETIYHHAPVGLCVLDRELRYVRINRRLAEINGFPPEAHIGQPLGRFVPDLIDRMEPALRRILQTGEPVQGREITGETPAQPGVQRTWVQNWWPLRDRDGQVVGLNCVIEEITERKQAEQDLRESERRFRLVLENSLDVIYWRDLQANRYEYLSPVIEKVLGYTAREFAGFPVETVLEMIHPDDLAAVVDVMRQAMDTGQGRVEYRIRGKDGRYRWLADHFVLTEGETGQIRYRTGVVRDVTGDRQSRQALQESEEHLRMALEASGMGSWEWDLKSGRIRWSDGHYHNLGYEVGEIAPDYETWRAHVHPEDLEITEAKIQEAMRAHQEYHHEHRIVRSDGSVRWLEVRGRFVYDPQDQPQRMYGVMSDITARKEIEAQVREQTRVLAQRTLQLRRLTAELMETEQRERKRLAQVLHDQLQQQLAAARLRAGLVQRHLEEELADELQKVMAMLSESLQTVRLLTTQLHPAVLHELGLPAALEWLGEQMQEHYDLQVQVEVDQRVMVHSEQAKTLLFDTARELLFNVVKHAKVQQARVTLEQQEDQQVRLCVEDDGQGFDPLGLNDGGDHLLGLGLLSIQERLAIFGGWCSVCSVPGQGTSVEVVLPLTGLGR